MNSDQLTPKLRKDYLSYLQIAWVFVAIAALTLIVDSATTLLSAIRNSDVNVPVNFDWSSAKVPFGEGGIDVAAAVSTGALTVAELPIAAQVSLIVAQVLRIGSAIVFIVLLYKLFSKITKGEVFSSTTIKLVDALTAAAVVFTGVALFFSNMAANSAFAQVSNYTIDNPVPSNALFTLFAALLAGCTISVFFRVGKNLADQSEGLV